jgi:hypothetical protein
MMMATMMPTEESASEFEPPGDHDDCCRPSAPVASDTIDLFARMAVAEHRTPNAEHLESGWLAPVAPDEAFTRDSRTLGQTDAIGVLAPAAKAKHALDPLVANDEVSDVENQAWSELDGGDSETSERADALDSWLLESPLTGVLETLTPGDVH